MHTCLQGRKISVDENCQRPPGEVLHLIRKLRWLGMEEEAEDLHAKLQETEPALQSHSDEPHPQDTYPVASPPEEFVVYPLR